MGWRNMFMKLEKKQDYNDFIKFLDNHNNYINYFDKETLEKMEEEDDLPGEDILPIKIIHNIETNEYFIYTGVFGGIGYTFSWQEKYFPNLKLLDSCNFKYYDDEWNKWPIYDYKDISCKLK